MSHWRCCCVSDCPIRGLSLVVGGLISNAGGAAIQNIAVWQDDGAGMMGWVPIQGLNGRVHALASVNGVLYAGGEFTASVTSGSIPGITLNRLARWDCDRWRPVGQGPGGGVNGTVHALKRRRRNSALPDSMYVAGDFTANSTGAPLQRHALYVPGSDTILPDFAAAPDRVVRAVGWRDFVGAAYEHIADVEAGRGLLGGDFTAPSANIARGDGAFATPTGNGANGRVHAALHTVTGPGVGSWREEAILGGFFTAVGGAACNRYGLFVDNGGGQFQRDPTVLGFTNGAVLAMHISPSRDQLFIGGSFTQREGGVAMLRVARSDFSGRVSPAAVGTGLGGEVDAICEYRGSIIAGGAFTTNGSGQAINRVAQLVGTSSWTQLGGTLFSDVSGVSGGPVLALCEHDFGAMSRRSAALGRIAQRLNRTLGGLRPSLRRERSGR